MPYPEPKSQEEWDDIKNQKRRDILKGQCLNLAAQYLLAKETQVTAEGFAKLLNSTAKTFFKELTEEGWAKEA